MFNNETLLPMKCTRRRFRIVIDRENYFTVANFVIPTRSMGTSWIAAKLSADLLWECSEIHYPKRQLLF